MSMSDGLLLQVLAEEHWPCPVCGYDLHRTTAPRCSECGRSLELRVTTPMGMERAWLVTLLVLAGEAGLGVLMLLAMLDRAGSRRHILPAGPVWDVLYYASFVLIPTPLLILGLRRWFTQMPGWIQWSCFIISGVIMGMTLIGMVIAIR